MLLHTSWYYLNGSDDDRNHALGSESRAGRQSFIAIFEAVLCFQLVADQDYYLFPIYQKLAALLSALECLHLCAQVECPCSVSDELSLLAAASYGRAQK